MLLPFIPQALTNVHVRTHTHTEKKREWERLRETCVGRIIHTLRHASHYRDLSSIAFIRTYWHHFKVAVTVQWLATSFCNLGTLSSLYAGCLFNVNLCKDWLTSTSMATVVMQKLTSPFENLFRVRSLTNTPYNFVLWLIKPLSEWADACSSSRRIPVLLGEQDSSKKPSNVRLWVRHCAKHEKRDQTDCMPLLLKHEDSYKILQLYKKRKFFFFFSQNINMSFNQHYLMNLENFPLEFGLK